MDIPLCPYCKEAPCTWVDLSDEVIKATDDFFATRNRNELLESPKNDEKRKCAYRVYAELKHGQLGRRNRVQNPECVLVGVRSAFPDEGGNYMGHRDT